MHLLKILAEIVKEISAGQDRKYVDTIIGIS